jgi:hypothetical protein
MALIISSITNDIIIKTITNITISVISTHKLFVWFIDHENNDYNIYKKKIVSTDLHNKLLIISALIKDTIKKHYLKKHNTNEHSNDITSSNYITSSNDDNLNIDNIMQTFLHDENETKITELSDLKENDDYTIINNNVKLVVFIEIPDPIKLALITTLEIINVINTELNKIQTKIQNHKTSFFSYIYSVKIQSEIDKIYEHSDILDKRVDLLFKVISAYN